MHLWCRSDSCVVIVHEQIVAAIVLLLDLRKEPLHLLVVGVIHMDAKAAASCLFDGRESARRWASPGFQDKSLRVTP